ncbi:MAG TPA: C2 family cysteine protease [Polyangiaceae bacterium]|nr:C2 family cysteine protease [Polyangiaceae bacterium]
MPDAGAGDPENDECHQFGNPGHSFDRCVHDDIVSPVLFAKQGGDVDAIDPKDVRQGRLGDCALLACVAGLSATPAGRALLRNAVVANTDERGQVTSFTVTLHERRTQWLGPPTFRAVRVTVAAPYVVGHANPRLGDRGEREIWPVVVEKAYAQLRGGYDTIDRGELPADALSVLTGRDASFVRLGLIGRLLPRYGTPDLGADLAAGKVVVLSTPPGLDKNAFHLEPKHAYYAIGITDVGGKPCVRLGNPWGSESPTPVPCDQLATWFSGVSVGSVP